MKLKGWLSRYDGKHLFINLESNDKLIMYKAMSFYKDVDYLPMINGFLKLKMKKIGSKEFSESDVEYYTGKLLIVEFDLKKLKIKNDKQEYKTFLVACNAILNLFSEEL